jgi:ribosomal protein L37E
VSANSVVVQAPTGTRFDSTLPARLSGVISAPEFAASIARCNAAIEPGATYMLARFLIFAGIVCWGVCWGYSWSTRDQYGGFNAAIMIGGICGMAVSSILGSVLVTVDRKNRIQALQTAVAAESAYYNSQQRAAQYGPLPLPISWSVMLSQVVGWYRRRHIATQLHIHIDLGGPLMVPVAAGPGMYVQPQFAQPGAPYQQPGAQFAQPLQQQQPPAYGAPWANQPEGQSAPQQGEDARAPLLAGSTNNSAGYGGHQVSAASCERCGRVASNAVDRFCPACGGPVSRR